MQENTFFYSVFVITTKQRLRLLRQEVFHSLSVINKIHTCVHAACFIIRQVIIALYTEN